jgi:periplasmic divalent cation tolerance protein
VASDLSACAQISEVESIYKWDGKTHDNPEYRLVIKAKKSSEKMIIAKIKEMHNYDLPQIISIDISGGDAEYLKWLCANS